MRPVTSWIARLACLLMLGLAGTGCSSSGGSESDAGQDAQDAAGGQDAGDADPRPDEDLPDDPCLGVVCDEPPDNACGQGENELLVYEAIGDCGYATGDCDYEPRGIKCMNPCVDGTCTDVELCAEAFCAHPPSPMCGADGFSIVRYGREGSCDPATGRCVYPASGTNCEFGCRFGRCLPPPGSDAALDVDANTRFCTFFWGGDILQNFQEQGRLTLREGVHPLTLDAAELEVDLIASLELAPEGELAQASGPARLFPSYEGTPQEGIHRVDIEQTFAIASRQYVLTGRVIFPVLDGRLVEPVMELYGDTRSRYDHFVIEGQYAPDGLLPMYSGCDLFSAPSTLHVVVNNGDDLTLVFGYASLGCREGGACAGEPFPGLLLQADVVLGQDSRTVDQVFDLSFTTQHHEDGKTFLMVFDEPVGSVHALHVPPGTTREFDEVQYLDAGFNVLQTRPIASYEYLAGP